MKNIKNLRWHLKIFSKTTMTNDPLCKILNVYNRIQNAFDDPFVSVGIALDPLPADSDQIQIPLLIFEPNNFQNETNFQTKKSLDVILLRSVDRK